MGHCYRFFNIEIRSSLHFSGSRVRKMQLFQCLNPLKVQVTLFSIRKLKNAIIMVVRDGGIFTQKNLSLSD